MKAEVKVTGPGSLKISYNGSGVDIVATRLHESRGHNIEGELSILGVGSAAPARLLIPTAFNFSSLQRRDRTAVTLAQRFDPVPWAELLEDACARVIEYVRQGEPVEQWTYYEDAAPPTYLVEPFMPENQFTIIFGDGGAGKSKFALVLYLAASRPWEENPLKLVTKSIPSSGIYLDWESSSHQVRYDVKCLFNGLDLAPTVFNYLHCSRPLADSMEQIQAAITKYEASFIIVDSLGAAAGGDLNLTEPAFRFISAIRQLHNVTVLALGHNAKNTEGRRSVYGNVYYTNEARSIWELRRAESTETDVMEIGLFHRKSNISRYYPPMGYKVKFGLHKISLEISDVKTVADFLAQMNLQSQILEVLRASGKTSVTQLAEQIKSPSTSIASTLTKLKRRGQVVNFPEEKTWGLAARLDINTTLTSLNGGI